MGFPSHANALRSELKGLVLLCLFGLLLRVGNAQTYSVIYSMQNNDGFFIRASVISDKLGNLYGTAEDGGPSGPAGTVFKLDPSGSLTVLYNFQGGQDGGYPQAPLVLDSKGNLYGMTPYHGSGSCPGGIGCGTVFMLDATGAEKVLHSFTGYPKDGWYPFGGLVRDRKGNLYGTTHYGGSIDAGTVFKIDNTGAETILHSFNGTDGEQPSAGLTLDKKGNLFGTTSTGGSSQAGTIFEIDSAGAFTTLHNFQGSDGAGPGATLLLDAQGNIYGTTGGGGSSGCGTAFMMGTDRVVTVLHEFTCGVDGGIPVSNLIRAKGKLWGTTTIGGSYGAGVLFTVTKRGKFKVVHSFENNPDGEAPYGGLVKDPKGNLFGTTEMGGIGDGTIYEVTP